MFSSSCLVKFSASIRNGYCIFPSMKRAVNCVFILSHIAAASSESNHSAAGPRKTEPKGAFLRSSYTVWMLFSFTAGLLPNEKLTFFSNKRINSVGSPFESIPINFSIAKSGYATVFELFLFNMFSCSKFVQFCVHVVLCALHVALT